MRKLALITGASAGIGSEFARLYAARGHDLMLTARRQDRLEKLASELEITYDVKVGVMPVDLTRSSSVSRILKRIGDDGRHVDVLVNNAGYTLPGNFMDWTWDDHKDFLQVMLTVPTELCHNLLGGMRDRGYGRVINVASLVSFVPGSKGHTLYAPVKAALMRLSESLNSEMRDSGVHITALCPGLTHTEFHAANHMAEQVSRVPNFMWQPVEDVVEAGFHAVEANRPVVVPGSVNKMIAALMQVLPGPVTRGLMIEQSRHFRSGHHQAA